jgi:hypothetical protein
MSNKKPIQRIDNLILKYQRDIQIYELEKENAELRITIDAHIKNADKNAVTIKKLYYENQYIKAKIEKALTESELPDSYPIYDPELIAVEKLVKIKEILEGKDIIKDGGK